MAKTMYDPWSKITTRNGYAGDEVISALQKSIRRGLEEQACMFAYELYVSSPQLEEKLWRRLLTISVEDIGMGNPMAAVNCPIQEEIISRNPEARRIPTDTISPMSVGMILRTVKNPFRAPLMKCS